MNYTEEMTEELIRLYTAEPTRATVDKLAIKFEKTVKSIIGKLSREGVYRREIYMTKTGSQPTTKAEMVEEISDLLNTSSENLIGLDKTPKGSLVTLLRLLEEELEEVEYPLG